MNKDDKNMPEVVDNSDKENKIKFSLNNKTLLKLLPIAVIAVLLIFFIGSCAGGGNSSFTKTKGINYIQKDNETLVTLDGKEIDIDEGLSSTYRSADHSLYTIKDNENTVFIVDGEKLVEVADEVSSYRISQYGDTIAYLTDVEDGIGTLFLYTVSNKKTVEISDDVSTPFILSPDGKSIAYLNDSNIYVSKNGKEGEKLYKNSIPVAITNGAKQVFYVKDSSKFYMNDIKLGSKLTSSYFYYNEDFTEVMFTEDGDTQYFTVSMKEPVKVKKGEVSQMYRPSGTLYSSYSATSYRVYRYGVKSLNNNVWRIENATYYVFKDGKETEKIDSYFSTYMMSENGKSILYQDGSKLYYVKNVHKSREKERVECDSDVDWFTASSDLKDIYYYDNEEEELYYLKGEESILISDDIEDEPVYSNTHGVLYFIEDDALYCATTSKNSKKEVCKDGIVTDLYLDGDTIFFRYYEDEDENDYTLMKITGKTKYTPVTEIE